MQYETTTRFLGGEETNEALIRSKIERTVREAGYNPAEITEIVLKKRSIDARKGKIAVVLRHTVYLGEKPGAPKAPEWKQADPAKRVAIVGSGPAGLFAALRLLEDGITPIMIERGEPTSIRKRDIADITRLGTVNGDSNYCFGEGGAGAFSDGKLYTRSNKRGDISRILAILCAHGADTAILTDAHPHVGSDRLPLIINAIRETIVSHGGEFRFNTRFTGLILHDGKVTGVTVEPTGAGNIAAQSAGEPAGAGNSAAQSAGEPADPASQPDAASGKSSPAADTPAGSQPAAPGSQPATREAILADAVILATGHSANDIYEYLAQGTALDGSAINRNGADISEAAVRQARFESPLEAKTFAVGLRVEHPRTMIDRIQYHGGKEAGTMPAAEYRLVAQEEERGVYSFCMCPGGLIVPSASDNEGIVVNGMSSSGRNGKWSNAAIVVETRPEDIPEEYARFGTTAGLRWRQDLEKEAKRRGDGQKAPAQRMTDFLARRESKSLPPCSYSPGVVPSRLDSWLPPQIAERLNAGFRDFDRSMHGFISEEAILVAIETRTSSPVRITRNADNLQCTTLPGLYPAGEGAGYAGGIVSSAMDGEKCAAACIGAYAAAHG